MSKYTRESLAQDLFKLGVEKGDVLFVRGNLWELGLITGSVEETIIGALLDVVGDQGTLIMPTFSRMFFIWSLDKTYIFDAHSKTNSGALSQSFLNICDKRSAHPSCSFAAKGPLAEALLSDHDHEAPPYLPLKKMLNYTNSKSLVFGCIKDSPGVITHVVQDDLGYASRNWLKYLRCVLYKEKTGKISLYKPKKIGGCSHGFKKFYTDYLQKGALKAGCFGNAGAFLADVKMTYSIDMEILKASPRNALCDNPICSWCCLFVTYNKRAYLTFVFKKTTFLIAKLIKFSRK